MMSPAMPSTDLPTDDPDALALPVVRPPLLDARPRAEVEPKPARRDRRHTILVAEDDPALLESIVIRLRHGGFSVLRALEGTTALELLATQQVDGLVLDVDLPGASGFAILDRARRPGRSLLPSILVTGHDDEGIERQAQDVGVHALLRKPVDAVALLAALDAALASSPSDDEPDTATA